MIRLQIDEIKFKQPAARSQLLLADALRMSLNDISGGFHTIVASCGNSRFLVNVREGILNAIKPDMSKLTSVCVQNECIGAFLYSVSTNSHEATGRFFAPVIGVSENIINGNSTGCVAAYLLGAFGNNSFDLSMIQGASSNAEGLVKASAKKNGAKTETWLIGNASPSARVSNSF